MAAQKMRAETCAVHGADGCKAGGTHIGSSVRVSQSMRPGGSVSKGSAGMLAETCVTNPNPNQL